MARSMVSVILVLGMVSRAVLMSSGRSLLVRQLSQDISVEEALFIRGGWVSSISGVSNSI